MVSAAETTPFTILSRQSLLPLLLSIIYLSFLIVPWVLTCLVALNPHVLFKYNRNNRYEPDEAYSLNYTILTAIEILNTLALVVSLPFLNFLLSRAVICFSQRRDERQKLTVAQLFGLADQGWWNPFLIFRRAKTSVLLVFGWILLALALAMPLVRSRTVGQQSINFQVGQQGTPIVYYSSEAVAFSPGPGILQSVNGPDMVIETGARLQSTTGGIEPNLWPYCNDQNVTRYYNRTCGFGYSPYDISHSALSNFWAEDSSSESTFPHEFYRDFVTRLPRQSAMTLLQCQYVRALTKITPIRWLRTDVCFHCGSWDDDRCREKWLCTRPKERCDL